MWKKESEGHANFSVVLTTAQLMPSPSPSEFPLDSGRLTPMKLGRSSSLRFLTLVEVDGRQ